MSWGMPQVTLSAKAHPAPVRYHPATAPTPAPIQVPVPAPVVPRTVSEAVGRETGELAQTTLAGWGAGGVLGGEGDRCKEGPQGEE